MMTGIGIVLAVILLVLAGVYGIVKLVLSAIGFIGGNVANAFNKARKK